MSKHHIAHQFERAASTYDQYAVIQYRSAEHLLKLYDMSGDDIVDLGAGSGILSNLLVSHYNRVILVDIAYPLLQQAAYHHCRIQADFDALPFATQSISAIATNMSLQWSLNYRKTFSEINRVMKSGAKLYLSLPIENTFNEMRHALSQQQVVGNQFLSLAQLNNYLEEYFHVNAVGTELWQVGYPRMKHLLRAIKSTGVSHLRQPQHKTLRGKSYIHELTKHYQAMVNQYNALPLTYHIAFVEAVKQ